MGNDLLNGGVGRRLRLLAAILVAFGFGLTVFTSSFFEMLQNKQRLGRTGRVAPYVPTALPVVVGILDLAQVNRFDVVYDLGSGDGRILIVAAQKFGARAVGVELDDKLFQESSARVKALALDKRVTIVHGDLFQADLRPATVVTLFLWKNVNERLRPLLEKQLRPGARVVSHDFQVPGWKPEKVVKVTSDDNASHTLYLYVR